METPATTFSSSDLCVSSGMMEEAATYYDWMMAAMKTHLKGDTLEVGCGYAVATPALARLSSVARVTAIDLSAEVIRHNHASIALPKVTFACGDFRALPSFSYDSIVCANVVEHIQDDSQAVADLCRILKPGGTLAFLVPAHPWLYTLYDHEAGHYRRYTRTTVRTLFAGTGLRIDRLFAFNFLGAVGWFLAFKVLQRHRVRESQSRFLIRCFRRFVLPLARLSESVVPFPFGLSIIALCTKP